MGGGKGHLMTELLVTDHAELDALGRDLLSAFDRGDAPEVLTKLDLMWARLAVHIRLWFVEIERR